VQLWTRLCARTVCRETRQQLCRTKLGAVDAAALRPFNKHAHGHRREKEVFSILVVISLVGTISGKSLQLLPEDVIF